jgi:hypothetical protein
MPSQLYGWGNLKSVCGTLLQAPKVAALNLNEFVELFNLPNLSSCSRLVLTTCNRNGYQKKKKMFLGIRVLLVCESDNPRAL